MQRKRSYQCALVLLLPVLLLCLSAGRTHTLAAPVAEESTKPPDSAREERGGGT